MPNGSERRTENKLLALQDRRVFELRQAADRMERAGRPITATALRNDAYLIENETGR